jgi:hypothetical protein
MGADLRALLLAIIGDEGEAIDVRTAALHAVGRQAPVQASVDAVVAVALHGACGRGGGDDDMLAAAALDVLRQQSFVEWLQEEKGKEWRYIQVLVRISVHERWVWRAAIDHVWLPETDLVQRVTLVEELEASLVRSGVSRPDGLVDALLQMVCDRDATIQAVVLRTLKAVGLESDAQVTALIQQLGVEHVKAVRKEIALVLSSAGVLMFPSAHGALLGLLRSDEAELRQIAIESLGKGDFGSDQAVVVKALEWLLDNDCTPNDHVRACIALCTLSGMAHSRALDGLLEIMAFPESASEPAAIPSGASTPHIVVDVSSRFKTLGLTSSLAHKVATSPVTVEWFDLANRALRALRASLQAAPSLGPPEWLRIQERLVRFLQTSQAAAETAAGSELIGLNSVIVETITTLGNPALRSREVVEALLSCVGVPTGMDDATSAMEDEIAYAAVSALVELGSLPEEVTLHLLGQLRWRSGRTLIALVGALSKMAVPVDNCETVETHVSKQAHADLL